MKTSNILIIIASALIVSFILAIIIITKQQYDIDDINENKIEIELTDFNLIVAGTRTNFIVEQAEQNKLVINYQSKKNIPKNLYSVRGDTLYINKNLNAINGRMRVYFKNITSLTAHNESRVYLEDIKSSDIVINTDNTRLLIANNNMPDDTVSITLNVKNNSDVRIENININKININADKSKIFLFYGVNINELDAKLTNHSNLDAQTLIKDPIIDTDSTSSYFFNMR